MSNFEKISSFMDYSHYKINVAGRVQGVFFRKYTKQKAEELQLNGFVQNETNGSVYIEAEGHKKELLNFMDWLHKGSPLSIVSKVEFKTGELKNFVGFKITY
jgi:acylphosphatase